MNRLSKSLAALAVVALVVAGLWTGTTVLRSKEEKVTLLDPAQVVVLRTPGGFLEVATLVKTETFGWRSSYTCLGQDCGAFLGERVGEIRVPVHYTYRVPLAESWILKLEGDAYVLTVPAPVPLLPPAIDTAKAEITSVGGGLLPPGAAGNQTNLLKNLGPELTARAQRVEYLRAQLPAAEKTVGEFAGKWMKAQTRGPSRPVRVRFDLAPGN
ncbi:hypothetical protein [Variovorax sp. PAMC 28711]|uniref:hypothetical protein n=1 Tax=Variovorax sp. PAMC 28711 TaxID=1795631 RepID=UPI000B0283D0|nr:hypothetical protein [Variovorax sp. PAMC 28711]